MIIKPSRGWSFPDLSEVRAYRELIHFFALRDIKVRYKQTALGAAWAVIQPFFTMMVFAVFFGSLARIPSEGIPYPIFAFAALVPWTYSANSITQASNSIVTNQNIVTKIYFPRVIIPLASMLSGLLDFTIGFAVLMAMMLYYGIWPGLNVILVPFLTLMTMATALAVGLWLLALNVAYRDVQYAIPFLVQFWLFATPIAYPSSLVPEAWKPVYGINPMAGVIEGFRWAVLGSGGTLGPMFIVPNLIIVLVLVTGLLYFKRTQTTFADVV